MAVGDHRPVASHGYEHNPHPTKPRNDPRSNPDQVNKPYPSPYPSQPQERPAPSSEPPLETTGYGYGHNPRPVQPQVYQVNEPYLPPHQNQPQGVPPPSSEQPPRTAGYNNRNPPSIQPQVHQQADVRRPKRGNGYLEPRLNQDQVNEPYPSPYPSSQPQVRPALSSEPPLKTAGYGYGHNPPLIQPQHGNGYPKPRPNQTQVNDHYSSPQEHEEGGYGSSNGVRHRLPSTEAKMYEDRHQNPPPVAANPNQPRGSPAVHGNTEKNRPDSYTYPAPPREKEAHGHGWGNYQSDQFNVHEHKPPSVTVKPPAIVSASGYPASNVRTSVNPQMHTQGQPYQDPSTEGLGFPDPNKSTLSTNKPKKVPSDAIPPAGGHGTSHGHSYDQSSPYKGDERSSVPPSGGQKVHVTVDVRYDPPGVQASVNGSSKVDEGSNQSGSGCCDNCSIM